MKHVIFCGKCYSEELEQSNFEINIRGSKTYSFHCDKCNSTTVISYEAYE